eukprot:3881090-Alexandrium_andersonii.AAC.1
MAGVRTPAPPGMRRWHQVLHRRPVTVPALPNARWVAKKGTANPGGHSGTTLLVLRAGHPS